MRSQDPYYKPAFRYVGRGVRVDVDKLHELERQKAIDKDKPIGKNPKRGKNNPLHCPKMGVRAGVKCVSD